MNNGSSDKKRDRRLIGIAGGVFALSGCLLGGFFLAQDRAARSQAATRPQMEESTIRGAGGPLVSMVPDISPQVKAEYIERATMLREKWEPWARAHQALLKRMMAAAPEDFPALRAVWDEVPENPEQVGMAPKDLMPSGEPFTGVGFGWAPMKKNWIRTSPPKAKGTFIRRERSGQVSQQARQEFKEHRDAVIAGGGMRTETELWLSGRITQRSLLGPNATARKILEAVKQKRTIRLGDDWGPTQEILPPYDFLASKAS